MSAFVNRVAQVYCDGNCGGEGTATDGSDVTIRAARATAKKLGWITRRVAGRLRDFCPACSAKPGGAEGDVPQTQSEKGQQT